MAIAKILPEAFRFGRLVTLALLLPCGAAWAQGAGAPTPGPGADLMQCMDGPSVRKQANCDGYGATNRCSVPVRARLCAVTSRGKWSCYTKSPLAPGETLWGACGNGEVKLELLPADSREKFPPPPGK